jgi:DNA-binding winged helix-turn-helix (wHTH) protein/TolB-like protein/Tfp pilus assembly protein PilF
MRLNTKSFYEFGPYRLEPEEHLLLRGEKPLPLAPKAFELLIFLVQNQGRLLTKDQIMQAIWRDCFVEEANLTVWISVLRKTLGEGEGAPQYIETVPKKGYRFIAEVQAGTAPELAEAQTVRAVSTSAREISVRASNNGAVVEKATAMPGVEVAGIADVNAPSRLTSEEAASASDWRKRLAIPLFLVSVGLLVLLAYLAFTRIRTASPKPPELRSLAVLPFRNLQPGASDDDFLGYSLADAVITKMGYVSSLSVRPSTAIEKYRNQPIDVRKVAADLNVDTLLTANYVREGDNLRITYQLIEAKTVKIIGKGTIDVKYDKLLHVQDSVAQEVIHVLELNLTPAEAERIKPDRPIDPLAYEYYLRGVDLHSRHEFPMAIQMLEKSRDVDPKYALTWTYLGASYNSAAAFQFGGKQQYDKARAAYEKALSLQPEQLEARMFFANLLVDTGNVEEAVPLLRDGLKTNPNHAALHWELGYAYRFAGMLQESVAECERAREIDPLVKDSNGSMLNAYLYLGEYDKFLESLPDDNNSAFVVFYRGFGEYYKRDWDQAAKDFDRAYALDPTLYTQTGKAFSDAIAHRNPEGLELLRSGESKIQQRGVGDPEGTYKIAQAYAALGDKDSALRVLRLSIESGFFPYPYFVSDPLLDSLRHHSEFSNLMAMAQKRHDAFRSAFF